MKCTCLLFCFLVLSLAGTNAQTAQFATSGVGRMRNYICWFDWASTTVANNASTSFITADGLNVTATFSRVSGPSVTPYRMNTWSGAVLWQLYDFTDQTIKPALFSLNTLSQVAFTITFTATRGGLPAPFTLVAADAEGSDFSETTTFTTTGTAWRTIELFRNSTQTNNPLTGCGTQTSTLSFTYGNAPATGQNPILATDANGSLTVSTTMNRTVGGGMAVAFGIFAPIDRGDLPASYSNAYHKLEFTTNNSCNFNPPFPFINPSPLLRLGTIAGDADGRPTLNDNAVGADEDAVSLFPMYNGSGSYSVNVSLDNSTGNLAFLSGYFDYNRDGSFSANESAVVTVPSSATSATLTWTGLPSKLSSGSMNDFAFRFRLSSVANESHSVGGYARDGEVEDYLIEEHIIAVPQTTVTSGFTTPDTVCVNTPVTFVNTSTGASSFYWNFCVADMNVAPAGTNMGNIGGNFSAPVFMDYAFDNGNYYGFVINYDPGGLTRLDFGNSLLNTPTAVRLGNFGGIIPPGVGAESIQIVSNEGKWYAIVVGGWAPSGSTPRILKIEFGPSLNNPSPVATNWGNLGNMSQPIDLHVFKEGNSWYGFTVNAENNTVTRFNFTNSFSNMPTAINLGNLGNLSYPTGIYAINDNGFWRVFIVNAGNNSRQSGVFSLSRLDFGSSLLNTPTGLNLGNPGNILQHPRDITIMKLCDQIVGFAVNGHMNNSDIIKLNFNNNLSLTPVAASLGVIANSRFPHSISKLFRVNNDLYSFITNVDNNTLTRLKFNGCNNSSISSSNAQTPAPIVYNAAGTYNINLTVDDGLPTQAAFCKQVVVVSLNHSATQSTSICSGGTARIGSSIKTGTYLWNTGATADSISVNAPGTYWVESSRYGCTVRDSFTVTAKAITFDFGFQQNLCSPTTVQFTTNLLGPQSFQWDFGNGQTNNSSQSPVVSFNNYGIYSVRLQALYSNGCRESLSKTITLRNLFDNSLLKNTDTTICLGDSIQIQAAQVMNYCWRASEGSPPSSLNTYVKPLIPTTYTLTSQVTGQNLVVNGDFSLGNSGFASQYDYFPASGVSAGMYNVGSTITAWHSGMAPCADHTTGSGNMMMVNGADQLNTRVWSQTIQVQPNTDYAFYTWLQTLTTTNPAQLRFSINGVPLSNSFSANAQRCVWERFSAVWNSGNNSTADISIINMNQQSSGNDFALDDIFFGEITTKTDSFTVNVTGLCDSVRLTGSNKVCSAADTLTYSIYKPANCNQQYVLQVDNRFATILSQTSGSVKLVFTKNGSTSIKVSYANSCKTVVDSMNVDIKFSPVSVNLGNDIIACSDTSVLLNAGGGFESYAWQNGSTDSTLFANASGIYTALAQNMCGVQFKDTLRILEIVPQSFSAYPAKATVCQFDSLLFTASGGTSYSWQPASNFTHPGAASAKAFVTASQSFTVSITDAVCRRDTVITIPVTASAAANITLLKSNDVNCSNDSAVLMARGGLSYTWRPDLYITRSFSGGVTVKPPSTQTYVVTGKDALGCLGVDSVTVVFSKVGDQQLYMPTGFTPNKDGLNDVFKPIFIGSVRKYDFRVYNRWGKLVFRSETPGTGWNGTFNSIPQPGDVYVYYIKAEGGCDGKFVKKGTFVLIR